MPILNQPIPDIAITKKAPTQSESLATTTSAHVVSDYEIATNMILDIAQDSVLEIT